MTEDESALYERAKQLGYNVRRGEREYSLTAMDGFHDGCVGGSDIESIHRWLDQRERGTASRAHRVEAAQSAATSLDAGMETPRTHVAKNFDDELEW